MSEEHTPSVPANLLEDNDSRASEPAVPSNPARPRFPVAPDPGRVPAIPGLIAPRLVSRPLVDGATGSSPSASPESPGLMRPQLPLRKPIQPAFPRTDGERPWDGFTESGDSGNSVESTVEPGQNSMNVELMDSRPGTTSKEPQAVHARHVPGPKRRPTPFPHPASTITAMRIISIGIEDDPLLSEMNTPLPEAPEQSDEALLPRLDSPPLPVFDTAPAQLAEPYAQAWAPHAGAVSEAVVATAATNLGAAELDAQQGSAFEPLPAFELTEMHADTERALQEHWAPQGEPAAPDETRAPLPSFELTEADDSAGVPAVERLPSFDLPDADAALAPEAPAARISAPSPPQRPSPPPPPPKPQRAQAQPVVLSEQDIAPDSVRPAPPAPPSRAAAGKSAPELVKPDSSAAPRAQIANADNTSAAGESIDAPSPTAKRNPPRPPARRTSLSPNEAAADAPPSTSAKAEEKSAARVRRPWWEELFDEDFTRAHSRLSDDQIKREANFIEESLGVTPGGVVLDLGCGSGYHAVELAARGYAVVGYDLSLHQLALAAEVAQDKRQKLNLMQGDMREMAFDAVFDGIYCWDTTFGYFEEDKNVAVAARIFQALKPGGTFLVDVVNRDFVSMHQPSNVWFEGDSVVCMDDMNVDFISSRLRVKRSLMLDDGRTRECTYSIRLYSLHELGKLLHDVGFRIAEASGQPSTPGVFMGQNAPRIIILAQRP